MNFFKEKTVKLLNEEQNLVTLNNEEMKKITGGGRIDDLKEHVKNHEWGSVIHDLGLNC